MSILFICSHLFVLYVCVYVFLHVCVLTKCIPATQEGQKRASEPIELKLEKVVSCPMGDGDWTLDDSNISKKSQPLSYFSSLV